jgi:hypothetical protein
MLKHLPVRAARSVLGAAAIIAALAAPAMANVEVPAYPTAIAADAAEMMAKYGGVIIDVESRFAGPSPTYFGCGVVKHEAKADPDHRTFNFTACAVPTVPVYYPPTPSTGAAARNRP